MPNVIVVRNVVVATVITATAYFTLLSARNDLLGHYLAGFGGTLLLLCALVWIRKSRLAWNAIVVTLVAVAIGFVTESSIFRFAFFDPVDFANQSLGACIACACVVDTRPDARVLGHLAVAGAVLLAGGFVFAFA